MRSRVGVIARDMACTALGLAGVIHQEWWGPVSIPLLILYATLLGVPGVAGLLALRSGTDSPPSQSRPGVSPSPSPQSSSSASSDGG
jgi:hypothetical protein